MRMMSTEDRPDEKSPNDVAQIKVFPYKGKKELMSQ